MNNSLDQGAGEHWREEARNSGYCVGDACKDGKEFKNQYRAKDSESIPNNELVELLSDESLQKSMKVFHTKPKLEFHSER